MSFLNRVVETLPREETEHLQNCGLNGVEYIVNSLSNYELLQLIAKGIDSVKGESAQFYGMHPDSQYGAHLFDELDKQKKSDPYAHLKQAQAEGKVIQFRQIFKDGTFGKWGEYGNMLFDAHIDCYRVKPEEPKLVSFEEALKWYKDGGDFRFERWIHKNTFRQGLIVAVPVHQILQDRWVLLPKEQR